MRVLVCSVFLFAGLVPFFHREGGRQPVVHEEAAWPDSFEGLKLFRLPLSKREERFVRDFPGRIARFSDGYRDLIIRDVRRPTRKLHPAADCLRGAGYVVTPLPIRVDYRGSHWSCVKATRNGAGLRVCEQIVDKNGKAYPDVSSWYWAAILGKSEGPWRAVTMNEPYSENHRRV